MAQQEGKSNGGSRSGAKEQREKEADPRGRGPEEQRKTTAGRLGRKTLRQERRTAMDDPAYECQHRGNCVTQRQLRSSLIHQNYPTRGHRIARHSVLVIPARDTHTGMGTRGTHGHDTPTQGHLRPRSLGGEHIRGRQVRDHGRAQHVHGTTTASNGVQAQQFVCVQLAGPTPAAASPPSQCSLAPLLHCQGEEDAIGKPASVTTVRSMNICNFQDSVMQEEIKSALMSAVTVWALRSWLGLAQCGLQLRFQRASLEIRKVCPIRRDQGQEQDTSKRGYYQAPDSVTTAASSSKCQASPVCNAEKRLALMFAIAIRVFRFWLEFAQCWFQLCIRRANLEIRKFCLPGSISTVTASQVQRQFGDGDQGPLQFAAAMQCTTQETMETKQVSTRHESDNCMTCALTTNRTICPAHSGENRDENNMPMPITTEAFRTGEPPI